MREHGDQIVIHHFGTACFYARLGSFLNALDWLLLGTGSGFDGSLWLELGGLLRSCK